MTNSQVISEEVAEDGLQLAADLQLPLDALTHVLGIVAQRGAGKSYTAAVEMEEMVRRGLFVGYIDPLGIAWGIRSSADGETPGLPVLIFGGRRGDLPLDPAAGKIVSQFVLEERQPFILDLSLFDTEDQQCQFVADFIEGFRLHEEVLLHLVADEADIFAPQTPKSPLRQRSLDAMNQLTRRFRYKGIGTTLITQRPAELHKSVLGQIDLLLALRVISPQDINALDEWIKRNASAEERTQFLATLSGLATGTAWAWSPQWLHLFRQVAIRRRKTYDSSATPKVGMKRIAPKQLAEIDLRHLNEQMSALFEKARATDPALLQARIRVLEEELRRLREGGGPRVPRRSAGHADAERLQRVEDLSLQVQQLVAEKEALQTELTEARKLLHEKEELLAALQVATNTSEPSLSEGFHAANVNFEQADIQHFYAGVGVQKNEQQDATVDVMPVETISTSLTPSENPLQRLLFSEKKSLTKLISQVQNLSPSEKILCSWLLEHDEQEISSQELADAVNLDLNMMRSRRTEKLVKLPFITRKGTTKFRYQATFGAYARRYFSSVSEPSVLVQELLKAAQ